MSHQCDSGCEPTVTDHGDGITETFYPHGGGHDFHVAAADTRDGVTVSTHRNSYYVRTKYTVVDPYKRVDRETTINGWSSDDDMTTYALHVLRVTASHLV
ncbi:hypothetical protein AB0F17_61860 [Nonomuraea sp. NPDC026600]|uniref:hypothetical protein n=1 Tax=Nonomuraea sp. NPDC026600 TaxID=3155363 RepID=UPI0033C94F48